MAAVPGITHLPSLISKLESTGTISKVKVYTKTRITDDVGCVHVLYSASFFSPSGVNREVFITYCSPDTQDLQYACVVLIFGTDTAQYLLVRKWEQVSSLVEGAPLDMPVIRPCTGTDHDKYGIVSVLKAMARIPAVRYFPAADLDPTCPWLIVNTLANS